MVDNWTECALKSFTPAIVVRGVLSIVVGLVAFTWPGITILALVILFAIYALGNAAMEGRFAFSMGTPARKIGRLLLALIDAGAGITALVWPGITAFVLVICIGAWALVGGVGEIVYSLEPGATRSEKSLFALGGVVSVIFGLLLVARPDLGAFSLAELFAFFAVFYGVSTLIFSSRRVDAFSEHSTEVAGR